MSGCSTLLNDDILREIAFHASRPTCLSLMRTCKFLYSEGAKAALRHPVALTHYMGMFRFLHFLHAGDRFRYVRELRICFVTMDLAGLSELEESIRLMTGLEALLFDLDPEEIDYAEDMLGQFPPLVDAISRIPHLRRIGIKGADPGAKDLMRTLQTNSLESVLLNWDFARHWVRGHPPFVGSGDSLPSLHPVPFLAKWTSTLQELTCVHWYNSPVLLVYPHVYPHMRRLTITKASGYLLLAPLIRAYPNLAYLNVDTFGGTGIDYSDPEEVRSINVSSQHAADAPGPWRSLEEVVGPVDELYALGLQAPIGILRIVDSVSNGSLEDFTAVLRDVQPRGIQLTADGELFLPRFAKLVRGPGASRLENIDLRVYLHGDLADKSIAAMLDDLCSGLVRLPLRRLHIRLAANELRPPSHTKAPLLTGELHTPLTPAERSLDEFDVDAYVRRLASVVESLTEAVVEIQDLRQRSTGLKQSSKYGEFRRVAGSG